MALVAGTVALTVEFARDLKDKDLFGKQDPYAVVQCGTQKFRTKTATDGGKNPVWNETFTFAVINENQVDVTILDDDTIGRDEVIGKAIASLAGARAKGADRQELQLYGTSSKQRGTVHLSIRFTPQVATPGAASGMAPSAPPAPQQPAMVQVMHGAPPGAMPYGAPAGYPPPGQYPPPGAAGYPPPAGYPPQAAPYGAPPPGAYPPPAGYPPQGAPPPGAYPPGAYPPAAYPPAPAGYPPGAYPPPAMHGGHAGPSGYYPAPHGAALHGGAVYVHGGVAPGYGYGHGSGGKKHKKKGKKSKKKKGKNFMGFKTKKWF